MAETLSQYVNFGGHMKSDEKIALWITAIMLALLATSYLFLADINSVNLPSWMTHPAGYGQQAPTK
jgi:ABC-type transport system involved in cytochrome c biogenesis permease component